MITVLRLIAVVLLLLVWTPSESLAQGPVISDSEAAQHIGQKTTVEGVVTSVTTSGKGNTFINFGGVHPRQTFTGWIPARTPLASDPSIHSLEGKKIKITGLIELYRGKPEIRILSRDQIAPLVEPSTPQPSGERQPAKSDPKSAETQMATYKEARPGEPFSLGGKYVCLLQSVESKPAIRKGYQILIIKEWVTNEQDSATDFTLQSECSIEIWDKNSNRVAEINQSYTEKDGHVAQSLNPGQIALFWECFEIPTRIAREGFKVEFIMKIHDQSSTHRLVSAGQGPIKCAARYRHPNGASILQSHRRSDANCPAPLCFQVSVT